MVGCHFLSSLVQCSCFLVDNIGVWMDNDSSDNLCIFFVLKFGDGYVQWMNEMVLMCRENSEVVACYSYLVLCMPP